MNKPYTIIVYLENKSEYIEKLRKLLLNATKNALKEDGCLKYCGHQDTQNLCRFVIYETWGSQTAFLEQIKKIKVIKLNAEVNQLLVKPLQVDSFSEL